MSETETVMEALKTALQAAYAERVVSRDLLDFDLRAEADLEAGIYTLIAGSEQDFPNYKGREGNFGTLRPVIVAQIKLAETATPSEVEDAEGEMIDEIKAFTRSVLDAPIDSLVISSINRSQQLDHPYGWVSFQMEMMLS